MSKTSSYQYWAFISYSNKDKSWARWLHKAIETYGIPAHLVNHPTPTGDPAPKRLRPIFRDRSELPASSDLGQQIEEALRLSRYLVVICSPQAARSKWVNKEIETFQGMGRGENVLAVIVDGEPNSGDDRECFPEALRSTEPIAADARKDGDGKNNAKIKLLAGMLGVGYDSLKQRDNHRRLRRLQIAIGLTLTLSVGFAGLALYANQQRETAVLAKNQAEQEATASKQVSDFLVGLFEVAKPGESRNEDVTVRELLDEGSERIYQELEDQSLVQARLLETMGSVYAELGHFTTARPMIEQALEIHLSQLGDQNLDVAKTLMVLGGLDFLQRDYQAGEEHFGRAYEIQNKLLGPDHNSTARSLFNLGAARLFQGKIESANKDFDRAVEIKKNQVGENSLEFAKSLTLLVDVYMMVGEYNEALPLLKQVVEIQENAFGEDHPDIAVSLSALASIHKELGQVEEADALNTRSRKILEESPETDDLEIANNLDFQTMLLINEKEWEEALQCALQSLALKEKVLGEGHPNTASNLKQIASLLLTTKKYDEAEKYFDRLLPIWEQELEPDSPVLGDILQDKAELLFRAQDEQEALRLFLRVLPIREKSLGPNNLEVASILSRIGLLQFGLGDDKEAQFNLERALVIFETSGGPENSEAKNIYLSLLGLAALQTKSGNYDEAKNTYERSLALSEKNGWQETAGYSAVLMGYGTLLMEAKDFEGARPKFENALEIMENDPNPSWRDIAIGYGQLGNLLREIGDEAKAKEYSEKAMGALLMKSLQEEGVDVKKNDSQPEDEK